MEGHDLFDMRREYDTGGINEKNLSSNPFRQFEIWFGEASESGEYEPNAMSLSTAGSNGRPSSRMVLLKFVTAEGFVFFTNYQSTKGLQIEENPNVSLLFFWQETMRQVRIEGVAVKVSPEISDKYFNSRPAESKASALLSKQSMPLKSKIEFDEEIKRVSGSEEIIKRPEHWGGYEVKPELFEFWQGDKGRSHDRFRYTLKNGIWELCRLYP
jgi:pyridoxamine 5'-phosphate oxidase